jgi:hypothetical protein
MSRQNVKWSHIIRHRPSTYHSRCTTVCVYFDIQVFHCIRVLCLLSCCSICIWPPCSSEKGEQFGGLSLLSSLISGHAGVSNDEIGASIESVLRRHSNVEDAITSGRSLMRHIDMRVKELGRSTTCNNVMSTSRDLLNSSTRVQFGTAPKVAFAPSRKPTASSAAPVIANLCKQPVNHS